MPEHATLYLARAIDIADVRAAAASASVTRAGNELATVQLRSGASVTINGDGPDGGIERHLLGLTNYINARCHVRDHSLLPRVKATVQVLGLVIEPGIDRGVQRMIALLGERGNGFVFLPHGIYNWYGPPLAVPREVGPPAGATDAETTDDEDRRGEDQDQG